MNPPERPASKREFTFHDEHFKGFVRSATYSQIAEWQ